MHNSNLRTAPLILISPETEPKGIEFGDTSISLSQAYQQAVLAAGGLPLVLPCIASREMVAESVRRCDGVLLTGGYDVNPKLYSERLPPKLQKTVGAAPPERDLRELMLIDEVFRQRRPVLGNCRGHQIMNGALGGTLVVDIPTQVPGALNHQREDNDDGIVEALELKHEAAHLLPYFMTVQFHPERLASRYPAHQELFNSFTRACVLNRNSNI